MKDGVLMLPKQLKETRSENYGGYDSQNLWSGKCGVSDLGGQRGLEGMLNKFHRGFVMLSARQKLRFLNGRCDTCIAKERSMPVRTREHVPSLTGYIREKLYVDLVSMSDTVRGN